MGLWVSFKKTKVFKIMQMSIPYRMLRWIYRRTRKLARGMYRFHMLRHVYPKLYKENAVKPVDKKKVVFIEVREKEFSSNFQYIYDALKDKDYKLSKHFLHMSFAKRRDYESYCKEMIRDIADAGYIFLDEASDVFAALPIRKKTVVTQLWHACGAFKKFGMSISEKKFGEDQKTLEKYPFHGNYTYVTVSSPEVVWAYEEAMNLKGKDVVKPLGIARTDYYYDKTAAEKAFDHLYREFPEAKGKKVILYAPTFRGHVAHAKTPNQIDIERFESELGKECVLLFKLHPFVKRRTEIPEGCEHFAKDVTDDFTIEELLLVTDVCISDYSSLVFEFSLLERPMLFYAYDLDSYFDWRGFYYPYDEFVPGEICKTEDELLRGIEKSLVSFEKDKVIRFKEKYMDACDGHATERIINTVFR